MKKAASILTALVLMAGFAVAENREEALERMNNATTVLTEIMAAPDKAIPHEILAGAECVAVIPGMKKGGLGIGGRYGKGFATCYQGNKWNAPVPVQITGGSYGAQIGFESVDLVMLIMNEQGLKNLLENKFRIGVDASAAAGPVGRHAEAATDWKLGAQVLTYSRSKGAFAGVTLNGAVLQQDEDTTSGLYGRQIPMERLVRGGVAAPAGSENFIAEVRKHFRMASTDSYDAKGKAKAKPKKTGASADMDHRHDGTTASGSVNTPAGSADGTVATGEPK